MNAILQQNNNNLVDAGECLYKSIKNAVSHQDKLCIDMEGVTSLPSILLNVSLGRVIDEDGKDKLKQSVGFVKITKQQAIRLRDYMSRYN